MRAIAVVAVAVVLAGCAQPRSDYSDAARKQALAELLAETDEAEGQDSEPLPAYGGTKSSDYQFSAETLATMSKPSDASQRLSVAPQPAAIDTPAAPSKWGHGWERFGDWYVKALHDDMDTVTRVRLFTVFNYTPPPGSSRWQEDFNLGFEIFGGSIVALSPSSGFLGKGYWPHCDYDLSSVSVDGAKAVRLTPVDAPGSCNRVDQSGEAIQQLRQGKNARIRLGYMDGTISLGGFSAAWARALQLSK